MIYTNQLESTVFDKIHAPLESLGYEIARIRIQNLASRKILQIMIERLDDNTISIDDCEKVSNYLSVVLDVEDLFDNKYNLEISSRGLDYPLTREKDFANSINKKIKLSVKKAINGRKKFSGTLQSYENQIAKIAVIEGEVYEIDFNNISDAQYDYFASESKFNNKNKRA